ncbi:MAG: DNA methyltransferase [Anaerolineales bacterium]
MTCTSPTPINDKMQPAQPRLPSSDFEPNDPVTVEARRKTNGLANKLDPQDRAVHDWYRFVLSYPAHLVREYLTEFGLDERNTVLDPFCGTGTTLVEAKRLGVPSVGLEANPFAHFASTVKTRWDVDADLFETQIQQIAAHVVDELRADGLEDQNAFGSMPPLMPLRTLEPDAAALLLTDSISPIPLHKTLVLLDRLRAHQLEPYYGHALLALANALVYSISNLHFGPEVGVGKIKLDTPVVGVWAAEAKKIAKDLRLVRGYPRVPAQVYSSDARQINQVLEPNSIEAVITSPPYPNEKDYTRTTRLESVILGFINNKTELRALKQKLIRSNTRGVYKDDRDDDWVTNQAGIQQIAKSIEEKRVALGKTSGFEKLYSRVTRLYFGGMAQHLAELRQVLRPGARLAYVVGDQASYFRVMIRTGQLLADIATGLGYELVRIDLFRTRLATATKEQLREEVVILRWPG